MCMAQGGWKPDQGGPTRMAAKLRCDELQLSVRAAEESIAGLERHAASLQGDIAKHEQDLATLAQVSGLA